MDGVDYTGDIFTAYSPNSCIVEGEYIFEYSAPGCYAPVEAVIQIFDSSKEQSLPPTIFLCRDGSEVTNYDYNWMYSDGSSVDNGGSGLQEIDVDEFIKQCNGDTIDGLVFVANPITGGYVVNPAQGDNYLLQFAYLAAPGKLTTAGLSDSMQTCGELDIQKYISSSSDDPGCTDIVPQKLVIGPIIDSYDETLATCDNTLNLYDNMPSGLLNMISLACNGTGTSGGGTLALYEMSTVAVSCNLPGSTLQIFYKDLLSTGPYLPLETTTTWNATDGSQVIFQVEWKPLGSPGFICGQETILTFDNEGCCDPEIFFQITGSGINTIRTCDNIRVGIAFFHDINCDCVDELVNLNLDYTLHVNGVAETSGNVDIATVVNGTSADNYFDIPIDLCNYVPGDQFYLTWLVNTTESQSGCAIVGQTDYSNQQVSLGVPVTETELLDCGCCIAGAPDISISNLSNLCDEPTCFGNRGEDYRFIVGPVGCSNSQVIIDSDVDVTWTVTDIAGTTAIVSETDTQIRVQLSTFSSEVDCNGLTFVCRDYIVTATACDGSTSEIQIVFKQQF